MIDDIIKKGYQAWSDWRDLKKAINEGPRFRRIFDVKTVEDVRSELRMFVNRYGFTSDQPVLVAARKAYGSGYTWVWSVKKWLERYQPAFDKVVPEKMNQLLREFDRVNERQVALIDAFQRRPLSVGRDEFTGVVEERSKAIYDWAMRLPEHVKKIGEVPWWVWAVGGILVVSALVGPVLK